MNFEKIYDKQVREKFDSNYESERWFKDLRTKLGYDQTKQALEKVVFNQELVFSEYLELGPGPGTWTKLFLTKQPEAKFTLVEISNEMIALAQKSLVGRGELNFIRADFMSLPEESRRVDFFFSSRALEYLPDKAQAVKKIFKFLNLGGTGILLTKNPRYFFYRLKGQTVPNIHRGQIKASRLKVLLEKTGFKVSGPYYATVTVPLFKSLTLDKFIGDFLVGRPMGWFGQFLAESYIFRFVKK